MLLKILILVLLASSIRSVPVSEITTTSQSTENKNSDDILKSHRRDMEEQSNIGNLINLDVHKPQPFTKHPIARTTENSLTIGDIHTDNLDYGMLADQPISDDGFKRIRVTPFHQNSGLHAGIESSTLPNYPETPSPETVADRNSHLTEPRRKENRYIMIRDQIMAARSMEPINNVGNMGAVEAATRLRQFRAYCSDNVPKQVKDLWKDDNYLFLYFNVSYEKNASLAAAMIRLYRTVQNDTIADQRQAETLNYEENKIRISVYWYIKQKKKVKKLLAGSVMEKDNDPYVEIDIKPAINSWTHTNQNLGLAIKVENSEEQVLKAKNYYRGSACSTNMSANPIGIPNIIYTSPELQAILQQNGINTSALANDKSPQINICTVLNSPGNFVKCSLNGTHKASDIDFELVNNSPPHIRHYKHLPEFWGSDPRSRMFNTRIIASKAQVDLARYNGTVNR